MTRSEPRSAAGNAGGSARALLRPFDWPFAWKLRGGVAVLLLVAALGVAGILVPVARNRAVTRALATRELAGLGLVLNVDRDGYQAVVGL
ncbi:MAG: hypothetical protein M3P24_05390, partial [Gemmatimonadota bacterium]|nr:hypothetical protein [Gemmatimonadota bacterium]